MSDQLEKMVIPVALRNQLPLGYPIESLMDDYSGRSSQKVNEDFSDEIDRLLFDGEPKGKALAEVKLGGLSVSIEFSGDYADASKGISSARCRTLRIDSSYRVPGGEEDFPQTIKFTSVEQLEGSPVLSIAYTAAVPPPPILEVFNMEEILIRNETWELNHQIDGQTQDETNPQLKSGFSIGIALLKSIERRKITLLPPNS